MRMQNYKLSFYLLTLMLGFVCSQANAQYYESGKQFNFDVKRWLNTNESSTLDLRSHNYVEEINISAYARHSNARVSVYADNQLIWTVNVGCTNGFQNYRIRPTDIYAKRIEVRHDGGGSLYMDSAQVRTYNYEPPVVVTPRPPVGRPPVVVRPPINDPTYIQNIDDVKRRYPHLRQYLDSNEATQFAIAVEQIAMEIEDHLTYEENAYINDILLAAADVQIKGSRSVLGGQVRNKLIDLVLVIDSDPTVSRRILGAKHTRSLGIVLMGLKEVILGDLAPLSRDEYNLIYGEDYTPRRRPGRPIR